jgi:signal transduction histidine kinase
MPGGGGLRIHGEVHSQPGKEQAVVEISDSGPGIAAENLQQIFHPGFTTCAGSPGLGLAVCQTIMQQHGGTITVHSQTGRGTTFKLEFPLWGAKP